MYNNSSTPTSLRKKSTYISYPAWSYLPPACRKGTSMQETRSEPGTHSWLPAMTHTCAPAFTRATVMASPMPRLPPVTRAWVGKYMVLILMLVLELILLFPWLGHLPRSCCQEPGRGHHKARHGRKMKVPTCWHTGVDSHLPASEQLGDKGHHRRFGPTPYHLPGRGRHSSYSGRPRRSRWAPSPSEGCCN